MNISSELSERLEKVRIDLAEVVERVCLLADSEDADLLDDLQTSASDMDYSINALDLGKSFCVADDGG